MLSGLHFFLTCVCLYECDHCFLYCGPRSQGTFTVEKLTRALDQAVEAGVSSVYFEGGAFADHCHLCFLARRAALDRFPDELCPRQVYGAE